MLTKLIRIGAIIGIIFVLIFYFFVHVIFNAEFQELNLLARKYAETNIPQNTGVHKLSLQLIQKLTHALPKPNYFQLNRLEHEIGVEDYFRGKYFNKYKIKHSKFVASEQEIRDAINLSKPGTEIIVKPGVYTFKKRRVKAEAKGEPYAPIILRAEKLGDVIFDMHTQEGLYINQPYWHIENMVFRGKSGSDSWVEHAIHLVGEASNIVISNNIFVNFNAHIKSNGNRMDLAKRAYPSNVVIDHNNFTNEWKRNTKHSVTPIDVVGGRNWQVINNFISDFGKNGNRGVGITYGAFLKGASESGVIENNLIACEWKLPHTSTKDIRIGLSFGGGGTRKNYCMDGVCEYEHKNGVMKGNSILNCVNDVGIYLNKSKEHEVYNNVIANSLGIDARFNSTSGIIYNNYLDGRIKARDGAKIKKIDNNSIE